jgi:hypothetical protein
LAAAGTCFLFYYRAQSRSHVLSPEAVEDQFLVHYRKCRARLHVPTLVDLAFRGSHYTGQSDEQLIHGYAKRLPEHHA